MYKAVFSDFDGTLLTSQHTISPRTVAAIKRLTANGIPFVPIFGAFSFRYFALLETA